MLITDTIKRQILSVPIEDVAEKLGISVRRHTALCFLHDDHHPSLAFNTERNRWRCYVCNVWGDNISLVQKYNNQSFVDACRWIAHNFGITLANDTPSAPASLTPAAVRPRPAAIQVPKAVSVTPDHEVLQAMVDGFHLTDKARRFLFDERHYSEDVVSQLRIFSVDTDSELLRFLFSHFDEQRVLRCQLAYRHHDGTYTPYFHTPSVFFPYFDKDGNIITLQARYLGTREECQRFQFPKGSVASIFNLPLLKDMQSTEPLFISEGVTDAIAMLSAGYKAIAIPSATLLHADMLPILSSHPLFMYPDNDDPGEKLFDQIRDAIYKKGGNITHLYLPDTCKDFSAFYLSCIAPRLPQQYRDKSTLFF